MECNNEIKLSGQVVKEYEVKHTIDNLPVVRFVLEHKSLAHENGHKLNINCKIYCLMLLNKNQQFESLIEQEVYVSGYLNQNSKSQIVLHVKEIKILNKGT